MHAVPEVTGEALVNYLERAVAELDIYVSCNLKIVNLMTIDFIIESLASKLNVNYSNVWL